MSFIIGVSGYFHDSSVCLIKNGDLLEFLKEEEFTRIKGTNGFPFRCLHFLVKKYGLNDNNIAQVIFYEKPLRGWAARVTDSFCHIDKSTQLLSHQLKQFWNGPIGFAKDVQKCIKLDEQKIGYCPHHLSHALSATPFVDESLLERQIMHLVLDGVGDDECQSILLTKGTKATRVFSEKYPNSLGLFYSAVTDFCGFLVNEGEYKLMALAAYGKPVHVDLMLDEMLNKKGHRIRLNMDWFDFSHSTQRSYGEKFIHTFGEPINIRKIQTSADYDLKRAADLAKSAQVVVESVIKNLIDWGLANHTCDAITITGGVAHNSLAMQAVCDYASVNVPVTIPPSPGDSGAAIGAAVYGNMLHSKNYITTKKVFFSKQQTEQNQELLNMLFSKKADTQHMGPLIDKALLSGDIICTFFSGKEIGPRALGNRSILCAANQPKTVTELNNKIKKREFFRPLAPIMLEETAQKYFCLSKNGEKNHQWMALTAVAAVSSPEEYNAALHIDKSARLQIIKDKEHVIFQSLRRLAGKIDMLINTSFNVAGDPIVHDIIDCYTNMKRLGLKKLITDNGYYELTDQQRWDIV